MPELLEGEAELRELASAYMAAEESVVILLAEAAAGQRAWATKRALERLAELRWLDHRGPLFRAYLFEHPGGHPDAVRDLAGSLAKRMDQSVRTAGESTRVAFRTVDRWNVAQVAAVGITAYLDDGGRRWGLGRWAEMLTSTLGRAATSLGVRDAAPPGATVTVTTSGCGYCQQFAGEYPVADAPLPPFHPSCGCTVSAE